MSSNMEAMAMLVIATVNSSTYQKCTEQYNESVFSPKYWIKRHT